MNNDDVTICDFVELLLVLAHSVLRRFLLVLPVTGKTYCMDSSSVFLFFPVPVFQVPVYTCSRVRRVCMIEHLRNGLE